MKHEQFEWDRRKAESNRRKHGVSFEQTTHMLQDRYADWFHLEWPDLRDDNHSDDDRWITLGSYPFDRKVVLYAVWSIRQTPDGEVTRIISCRKATRWERLTYEQAIRP